MDIFDEDDINGRFRRKKKLKVSEKFEKLAAFARAFEKNIGDEDLIFLSDPEESDHGGATTSAATKDKAAKKSDKDRGKSRTTAEDDSDSNDDSGGEKDDEVEEEAEESLNTDKRAERLQKARTLRDAAEALSTNADPLEHETLDNENDDEGEAMNPIDEYKETLRRTKVIRGILEGLDDEMDLASQSMATTTSSQRRVQSSTFNLLDRIVDTGPVSESHSHHNGGGNSETVDVTAIARPRMLARQHSSFLSEERRTQFLSTVGEESRGGNASNRIVKDVNRRKMAFATSKRSSSSGSMESSNASSSTLLSITSSSSSSSTASFSKSSSATLSGSGSTSARNNVPGKVPRMPSDGREPLVTSQGTAGAEAIETEETKESKSKAMTAIPYSIRHLARGKSRARSPERSVLDRGNWTPEQPRAIWESSKKRTRKTTMMHQTDPLTTTATWSLQVAYYGPKNPFNSAFYMALFNKDNEPNVIERDSVIPPPSLQRLIVPWIEGSFQNDMPERTESWIKECDQDMLGGDPGEPKTSDIYWEPTLERSFNQNPGKLTSTTLVDRIGFLKLLFSMRRVILQDAVFYLERYSLGRNLSNSLFTATKAVRDIFGSKAFRFVFKRSPFRTMQQYQTDQLLNPLVQLNNNQFIKAIN
ncbi:hypothetical protein BGZ94_003826 [Podila epigama]|nr:hypothetical protein BGZ94_003826 [Podila epigama]